MTNRERAERIFRFTAGIIPETAQGRDLMVGRIERELDAAVAEAMAPLMTALQACECYTPNICCAAQTPQDLCLRCRALGRIRQSENPQGGGWRGNEQVPEQKRTRTVAAGSKGFTRKHPNCLSAA